MTGETTTTGIKTGITLCFDSFGETRQVELVRDAYGNGELAVMAYLSDPVDEGFGGIWGTVTVNLNAPLQEEATVLLDTNNMGRGLRDAVMLLGTPTGEFAHSGFCAYPAFTFDAEVMGNMRDANEFFAAEHTSLSDVRDACRESLSTVYGGEGYDLSAESRDMASAKDGLLEGDEPAVETLRHDGR